MDLRKTLVSVLWILLLNIEEECLAEEGMWKKKCGVFVVVLPKSETVAAAAVAAQIDRQMSADSLAFVLWGEAGAFLPLMRGDE